MEKGGVTSFLKLKKSMLYPLPRPEEFPRSDARLWVAPLFRSVFWRVDTLGRDVARDDTAPFRLEVLLCVRDTELLSPVRAGVACARFETWLPVPADERLAGRALVAASRWPELLVAWLLVLLAREASRVRSAERAGATADPRFAAPALADVVFLPLDVPELRLEPFLSGATELRDADASLRPLLRVLAVRTAVASATREGLAEVRVLRSTSGR